MNKFLFLACLVLSFGQALSAQWSFGLKAGLNRSNVETTTSVNFEPELSFDDYWNDPKIGFHVGLMGAYAFSDKVALRGELLYSTKGFKNEVDSFNTESLNLSLNYLSLPILLDYQPLPKLHLVAGPSFGHQVSLSSKPATAASFVESVWDNPFDLSLTAGLEYSISEHLGIGVRYVYGLSSTGTITYTDENAMPIGDGQFKNRTLQISAMFWL